MQIVDNSPEMALDDPKFSEMLATIKPAEAKADTKPAVELEAKPVTGDGSTQDKPDVKPNQAASSAESAASDTTSEDEPDETPEKMKARIRGLQAELTRRKGNADKVSELELQLAKVHGQLEQLNKPSGGEKTLDQALHEAVQKLDIEGLISKQTDWEDELADARARYAVAQDRSDDQAVKEQGQRIVYAKKTLSAIRQETLERTKREQTAADVAKSEAVEVRTEFDSMLNALNEVYPDFQNKDTDLWKAGNKEFMSHPKLMARLGPAGEIVAAALAVVKNPQFVKQRSESSARREVVEKLESGVKKALSTGAASPNTRRTVVPAVDSSEGLADFNKLVDRIKGG